MPVYYEQENSNGGLDSLVKLMAIGSSFADIQKKQKEAQSSQAFQQFLSGVAGGKAGVGSGQMGNGIGMTGFTVDSAGRPKLTFGQTPDAKRQQKNLQKLDDYSDQAINALQALNKVGTKAAQLGDFERGFTKQMGSKLKFVLAEQGKDKDVTEFVGAVQQELIPLGRNLVEEKGPITDSDVKKLEKGLTGGSTTPLEDKLTLIDDFKKKVRLAVQNKLSKAGVAPEELRQRYPVLFDQLTTSLDFGENDKGERAVAVRGFDGSIRNIIPVNMFGAKKKAK